MPQTIIVCTPPVPRRAAGNLGRLADDLEHLLHMQEALETRLWRLQHGPDRNRIGDQLARLDERLSALLKRLARVPVRSAGDWRQYLTLCGLLLMEHERFAIDEYDAPVFARLLQVIAGGRPEEPRRPSLGSAE